MKKILLVIFLSAIYCVAFAQKKQKQTDEQRAEKKMADLTEALTLDADQQTQVKNLFIAKYADVTKAKEEANGDEAALKAAKKEARKSFNTGMKEILNDEQEIAWKAYKKAEKAMRKEKKAKKKKKEKEEGDNG